MGYAFVLGGTKGLGLALAIESYKRGCEPIIAGRSANSCNVLRLFPPGVKRLAIDLNDQSTLSNLWNIRTLDIEYVFWVAGIYLQKRFVDTAYSEMDEMVKTHFGNPIKAIQILHSLRVFPRPRPYHFVAIASRSSWKLVGAHNETLYGALKAAKAAFTRNFAAEVIKDSPGSKITLFNPGGIKTPNFWKNTDRDISNFMNPEVLASLIWDEIQKQTGSFQEIQIHRNEDGTPKLEYSPRLPEVPV